MARVNTVKSRSKRLYDGATQPTITKRVTRSQSQESAALLRERTILASEPWVSMAPPARRAAKPPRSSPRLSSVPATNIDSRPSPNPAVVDFLKSDLRRKATNLLTYLENATEEDHKNTLWQTKRNILLEDFRGARTHFLVENDVFIDVPAIANTLFHESGDEAAKEGTRASYVANLAYLRYLGHLWQTKADGFRVADDLLHHLDNAFPAAFIGNFEEMNEDEVQALQHMGSRIRMQWVVETILVHSMSSQDLDVPKISQEIIGRYFGQDIEDDDLWSFLAATDAPLRPFPGLPPMKLSDVQQELEEVASWLSNDTESSQSLDLLHESTIKLSPQDLDHWVGHIFHDRLQKKSKPINKSPLNRSLARHGSPEDTRPEQEQYHSHATNISLPPLIEESEDKEEVSASARSVILNQDDSDSEYSESLSGSLSPGKAAAADRHGPPGQNRNMLLNDQRKFDYPEVDLDIISEMQNLRTSLFQESKGIDDRMSTANSQPQKRRREDEDEDDFEVDMRAPKLLRRGTFSKTSPVENGHTGMPQPYQTITEDSSEDGNMDIQTLREMTQAEKHRIARQRAGPQQRSRWNKADELELIRAVEKFSGRWSEISRRVAFSEPKSHQQVRDKARNLKVNFLWCVRLTLFSMTATSVIANFDILAQTYLCLQALIL